VQHNWHTQKCAANTQQAATRCNRCPIRSGEVSRHTAVVVHGLSKLSKHQLSGDGSTLSQPQSSFRGQQQQTSSYTVQTHTSTLQGQGTPLVQGLLQGMRQRRHCCAQTAKQGLRDMQCPDNCSSPIYPLTDTTPDALSCTVRSIQSSCHTMHHSKHIAGSAGTSSREHAD
jgi:hypothetical protein